MGHLSANPAEPHPLGEGPEPRNPESKGHRWFWIVTLATIIAVGYWYFRGPRASTEAQGPVEAAEDRAAREQEQGDSLCQWSSPRRSVAISPCTSTGLAPLPPSTP
jgi:hypothetical protein